MVVKASLKLLFDICFSYSPSFNLLGVLESKKLHSFWREEIADQIFHQLQELFHEQFLAMSCCFHSWEDFDSFLVGQPRSLLVFPIKWLAPTVGYKLNSDN